MSADGTSWPKRITDGAASAGSAVHNGPNGTASKTVTTSALSAVTLRARGTQCQGAPVATVTLDGTTIGTVSVSSTTWANYRLPVSRPAGTYRVAVSYNNNFYDRTCNRDLFLDRFILSEADTAPPPANEGSVTGRATLRRRSQANGRRVTHLMSIRGKEAPRSRLPGHRRAVYARSQARSQWARRHMP